MIYIDNSNNHYEFIVYSDAFIYKIYRFLFSISVHRFQKQLSSYKITRIKISVSVEYTLSKNPPTLQNWHSNHVCIPGFSLLSLKMQPRRPSPKNSYYPNRGVGKWGKSNPPSFIALKMWLQPNYPLPWESSPPREGSGGGFDFTKFELNSFKNEP